MYETLFKSCLNPFFETVIKKRKSLQYRAELEASQWFSSSEIQAAQWDKLGELLVHAYQQAPYWKKVFDDAGLRPQDITSYTEFCKLPLVSREDIKTNLSRMQAQEYKDRLLVKSTGGSTGDPLTFYYDYVCYQHRVAISQRGYGWAQCEDGRRQFHLWGMADHKKPRLTRIKTRLHRIILRHKYFNCLHFTDARKLECLKLMNRYKPRSIVGYPSALYRLARFIEDNNHAVTFTPESIITGAEKIFDTQRETIEKVFKSRIFNSYGSREFMLLAMECAAHDGLHVSSENVLLEVVGEDGQPVSPGEQGEIVITDLHNYGMPFIRYRIGDQAIQGAPAHDCSCGRGLPKIQDVTGRTLDIIRLPDGNEVPGELFVRFVGRNPGVSQFRVLQVAPCHLVFELVVDQSFTDKILEKIKRNLRKNMDEEVKLEFRIVDKLEATPTGKFRVTISYVS